MYMFSIVVALLSRTGSSIVTSTRPTRTFYRRVSFDKVEFGGSLEIDSTLSGVNSARFAEFLSPLRVVSAAWDADMVERVDSRIFRLKQDPLDFAGALRVETTVQVEVEQEDSGGLRLSSREIESVTRIGRDTQKLDIDIKLDGRLIPQEGKIAVLKGSFEYTTGGKLVGPLLFLPDPVLDAAATAVNTGILNYARDRFVDGIVKDFWDWDRQQRAAK